MVYSTGTYGGFISELDVNITGDASNWTLFQYSPCSDESSELFRVSFFNVVQILTLLSNPQLQFCIQFLENLSFSLF